MSLKKIKQLSADLIRIRLRASGFWLYMILCAAASLLFMTVPACHDSSTTSSSTSASHIPIPSAEIAGFDTPGSMDSLHGGPAQIALYPDGTTIVLYDIRQSDLHAHTGQGCLQLAAMGWGNGHEHGIAYVHQMFAPATSDCSAFNRLTAWIMASPAATLYTGVTGINKTGSNIVEFPCGPQWALVSVPFDGDLDPAAINGWKASYHGSADEKADATWTTFWIDDVRLENQQ